MLKRLEKFGSAKGGFTKALYRHSMRSLVLGLSLGAAGMVSATVGAAPTVAADQHTKAAADILKNPHRKAADHKRDAARHPLEVMKFFDITPTSTVVEVNPGGMWYSRILGPYLKDHGQYIGLEHHPVSYTYARRYSAGLRAYRSKMAGMKDIFGPKAIAAHLLQLDSPVKDNSVDTVMVVRAMHNWQRRNFMEAGLAELHRVLKDGGILGVVQHREAETSDKPVDETVNRGRWRQSELIKVIESHGFKLVATSEMNANPKDKDGIRVWMLPPILSGPDETKDKMLAIGESDRMTLKFKKVSQ